MTDSNLYTVNGIISAFDSLHGKIVRVAGVLIVEFEGNSLWHVPRIERRPGYESSIWAEFDFAASRLSLDQLGRFDGRHVLATGIADQHFRGHFDLWPGTLHIVEVVKMRPMNS